MTIKWYLFLSVFIFTFPFLFNFLVDNIKKKVKRNQTSWREYLSLDWLHVKVKFNAFCSKIKYKKVHTNLGVMIYFFDNQGKWPHRYIRDFTQKNIYEQTPLEWAFNNTKKARLSSEQWEYLLKKSKIQTLTQSNVIGYLCEALSINNSVLSEQQMTYLLQKYPLRQRELIFGYPVISLLKNASNLTSAQWMQVLENSDIKDKIIEHKTVLMYALENVTDEYDFSNENWLYLAKFADLEDLEKKYKKNYSYRNYSQKIDDLKSMVLNDKLEKMLSAKTEVKKVKKIKI